jgi:hypothetical protein
MQLLILLLQLHPARYAWFRFRLEMTRGLGRRRSKLYRRYSFESRSHSFASTRNRSPDNSPSSSGFSSIVTHAWHQTHPSQCARDNTTHDCCAKLLFMRFETFITSGPTTKTSNDLAMGLWLVCNALCASNHHLRVRGKLAKMERRSVRETWLLSALMR